MKQTPVLKHSVLCGKEQPQSIGAAVLWTYAPVCTKSSHWSAGRRLEKGRVKGNPPPSRGINANAGPHPGVDFGTQTLTGLQGLLSLQRPLPARLQA